MTVRRDAPLESLPRRKHSARTRVLVAGAVGVLVGAAATLVMAPLFSALVGWDAATLVFIAWVWVIVWPLDAATTAALASSEDPTRAEADVIVLTAAVASLIAVGFVLVSAAHASGTAEEMRVALGAGSIVLSWGVVHTIFTLRYARIYYKGPDGGISFNQSEPPAYTDFAYLALTIGMTFQVSDTELQTTEIRKTALQHALLSYVFATGILAAAVNLVATLVSQ